IVLAISRERCVFHVDRVWTSTRGGSGPCGQGRGGKNQIFLWTSLMDDPLFNCDCLYMQAALGSSIYDVHKKIRFLTVTFSWFADDLTSVAFEHRKNFKI